MNALVTLIRPFVDIVAHRVGPDVLPASRFLLGLVVVLHLAVYVLDLYLVDTRGTRLIAMPLLDTLAQSAFFAVLLFFMGFPQRILQTLTAAFGADLVFELAYVPVALATSAGADSPIGAIAGLGALVLLLWSLAVKGHILERASGLPYVVGVTIALAFTLGLYALDLRLFGS